MRRSYFEAFHGNLVPPKFQTIQIYSKASPAQASSNLRNLEECMLTMLFSIFIRNMHKRILVN